MMTACVGVKGLPSMRSQPTLSSQWGVSTFIPLVIAIGVIVIEIPVRVDQGIFVYQELRPPILGM